MRPDIAVRIVPLEEIRARRSRLWPKEERKEEAKPEVKEEVKEEPLSIGGLSLVEPEELFTKEEAEEIDRLREQVYHLGRELERLTMDAGRPPSLPLVQRLVAECLGLPLSCMKAAGRVGNLVRARHYAMWIGRRVNPSLSVSFIGRQFGGRDHTTVLHALRRVQGRLNDGEAEACFVVGCVLERLGEMGFAVSAKPPVEAVVVEIPALP